MEVSEKAPLGKKTTQIEETKSSVLVNPFKDHTPGEENATNISEKETTNVVPVIQVPPPYLKARKSYVGSPDFKLSKRATPVATVNSKILNSQAVDETSEGGGIKHLGTVKQIKGGGKIAIDSALKNNTYKKYGTIPCEQKSKPEDFHSIEKFTKEDENN
jgi:hypothetical protein